MRERERKKERKGEKERGEEMDRWLLVGISVRSKDQS
jgi:hypothetical protein